MLVRVGGSLYIGLIVCHITGVQQCMVYGKASATFTLVTVVAQESLIYFKFKSMRPLGPVC